MYITYLVPTKFSPRECKNACVGKIFVCVLHLGEENSTVTAHISKSGIITASISTVTETYHLEPSQDFIKRPHPPHMIAYRSSDVKRRLGVNGSRFDYVVAPPLPPDVQTPTTSDHHEDHQTVKRQSEGNIGGTSCSMIIVADYRFYDQFAAGGNEDENIAGITRRLVRLCNFSKCVPY